MPYSAEISRTNPSCFLFLIDQSGSMQDPRGDGGGRPGGGDAGEGPERGRRHQPPAAEPRHQVRQVRGRARLLPRRRDRLRRPASARPWAARWPGRDLVPISEIANPPARVEERTRKVDDGAGGLVEQTVKLPGLVRPDGQRGHADVPGAAPGADGAQRSGCRQHQPELPADRDQHHRRRGRPTAIRSAHRRALKALRTSDGNVPAVQPPPLVAGGGAGAVPGRGRRGCPTSTPSCCSGCPARCRTSCSESPGTRGSPSRRASGFVFNADMVTVIRFLDIGTRPSNLR